MADDNKVRKPFKLVDGFLGFIERIGNLLPHPVMLFAWLGLFTILLSGAGAYFEWAVADPRPEGAPGRAADGMVRVESLMSDSGLRRITTELVNNFVKFAPLGTVLVALLGVGVAEHSGLLSAAIRLLILGAPKFLVTAALVFAGVVSNTASEVGYVVVVPMGAAIYFSLNRHPLAGLAAAFAGVSGGYSANLLLGTVDPLLSGITTAAAQSFDPSYETNPVSPACNLYFMMASTFLVTIAGTIVSLLIIEPRLGAYSAKQGDPEVLSNQKGMDSLTVLERRGLIATGISILIFTFLMIYLCVSRTQWETWTGLDLSMLPWLGALAEPAPGKSDTPAFLDGVVAVIFVGFLIPGIVYGVVTGSIRKDEDVLNSMSKSMSTMGMYIVLVFFAAQFVEFFRWSNLGTLLAIQGAEFIRYLKLDNPLIFLFFILVCAFVNLVMGSASAKWTFMAPIFVPMLMDIGYSPELIQMAYRIGDSCTNVISPMMSYFGMIFVFAARYERDFKLGSLISLMLPYSVIFLILWTIFFYLWVFLFNFPIGPMAPIFYPAGG